MKFSEICTFAVIYAAYLAARRGKRSRAATAYYEVRLLENIVNLVYILKTKIYRPGVFRVFYVYEPKKRLVQAPAFVDKVVQHAIVDNLLYDRITRSFILDNYASQKNKGLHFGLDRLKGFFTDYWNKHHTAEGWVLKCDVRHFFASIYNEIKRGWTQQMTSDYEFIWCYCPEMAERKYQENLRAKGPDLKIGNDIDFANYVEQKIVEEHYSPAALLAELKAKPPQFDTTVCEATLYNYIYRGDVFLVLNPEHLHEKGRRHYGEKYGEQRNAARAAKGPRIDKRDPIINSRTTFGHWEMDSVMGTVGSSRALVVLTERLTRAGIILPVPDHTAASVVRALNGLERRLGKDFYPMFQSITVDNGCEFQDYDGMEKACRRKGKRTTVYYCHPHAPHERGSNENMNRIIRRFFPKGTNFDEVPISEIRRAEEWMNNYPREVLGWQTAATLLRSYMSAC